MRKIAPAAALLAVAFVASCSSSGDGSTGSSSSSGGSSDGGPPRPSRDAGSSSDASLPRGLDAPEMLFVMKMAGALHAAWRNFVLCDAIEVERKAEGGDGGVVADYKVVFTLPGTATNRHDDEATENLKYTYRVRCQTDGAYSTYSNEMSGNPVQ